MTGASTCPRLHIHMEVKKGLLKDYHPLERALYELPREFLGEGVQVNAASQRQWGEYQTLLGS